MNTTIPISQELIVECSVSAKPGAVITWIYGSSGSPDPDALAFTYQHANPVPPYTTNTTIMRWGPGDTSARKTVNGKYTCRGNNDHGEVTSWTMTLNVQCEY